jgi:prevent-host-death family protein
MSSLPLSEVKARLSEISEEVERTHERVHITRNGRRYVVLIAEEDLESLEATLELLADPEAVARIAQAEKDLAAGTAGCLTPTPASPIDWFFRPGLAAPSPRASRPPRRSPHGNSSPAPCCDVLESSAHRFGHPSKGSGGRGEVSTGSGTASMMQVAPFTSWISITAATPTTTDVAREV